MTDEKVAEGGEPKAATDTDAAANDGKSKSFYNFDVF